ncbi:pumilio homolog 3 isoform X2 [Macrosteles quadrilineatus]|nr:pumilio homolog 3 isoform X2 [Macrosteles quadrilineatus]
MKRGPAINDDHVHDRKKIKTFSPQKETKQKFEKKTSSKIKNSIEKGKKIKIKAEQGTLSLKQKKLTVSPKNGLSGKQKIKNSIKDNLLKKAQFTKDLATGKQKTKIKGEFPTDKDGKPLWNKVKSEKKKLKETRKAHRTGEEQYQISVKAKAIWEKLRGKNHTDEKKEALVNELFMLLKGQTPNIVFSHDMARVIQWMLKLGSPAIRSSLCEDLSSNTVAYLQSRYSSFCVKRALKYASKADRSLLIQSCNGHFLKLFSHLCASPVIELMYAEYASAAQRRQIHREMYGEMHALVAPEITSIQNIPKNMRPSILTATKSNLTKLLLKKQLFKYTLLQTLLQDFLASCSEQDRNEILELIQGDVLEFLNTKEGSRVALQVVWHGTNKVKKVIVKALKGKVKETACSEVGHILLLALFDCVDDTVLVKKALLPEVVSEAVELAKNEWGRKVILYLVAHRDPAYFHPQQIEVLAKGDAIGKGKKDPKVREQEMLEAVSSPLLSQIAADPATWLGESSIAMVTLAIIKSAKGDNASKEVFERLVDYIMDPDSSVEVNDRKIHVIEDSALHLVFKKLIQQHSQQMEADKTQGTFPKVLVSRLTGKELNFMMQFNRGCFLLVLMFELKCKEINNVLKKKITEPMKKYLQKQETTGSKILLKKLNEVK